MDYCPWTQSMPSRDVNAATRLAEAMYSPSSGFTGMGLKKYAQFSDVRTMVLRTGQTRGPKSPIYCTWVPSGNVQGFSLILDLGDQLMCIQRYSYVQGVSSQALWRRSPKKGPSTICICPVLDVHLSRSHRKQQHLGWPWVLHLYQVSKINQAVLVEWPNVYSHTFTYLYLY